MSDKRLSEIIYDYEMGIHLDNRDLRFFLVETDEVADTLFRCGPAYQLVAQDLRMKRHAFQDILTSRARFQVQR